MLDGARTRIMKPTFLALQGGLAASLKHLHSDVLARILGPIWLWEGVELGL